MNAPNSRRTWIFVAIAGVGCSLIALLALVVVLIVIIANNVANSTGDPDARPARQGSDAAVVTPPGVDADQPYLELSQSADGPVVDVYIDFLCPHCATFHDAQGEDLIQLALDNEITLRMHPRPMLDASSTPAGYSGRAANAAVCAYAENPEQWFPAEIALFSDQPGPEGLTDEELTQRVNDATGLDVSACIAEGTYLPWIESVVEPEALEGTPGTPTVLIDGERFAGDPSVPGSVKEAIDAA